MRLGDGVPALIKTDVEHGNLAPEKILLTKKLGSNSAVVFGFSSLGGGNQTLHAILIKYSNQRTQISDHLQMHVRRGAGGFLWSSQGELFLIEPSEGLDDDDVFLESSRSTVKYGRLKSVGFIKEPKQAIFVSGPMGASDQAHKPVALIPISKGRFDLSTFSGTNAK